MASTTTTRALTAGVAVVLAASGVLGGGVADAGDGTTCTPTTRTLDTLTYSSPAALSPRGHVVSRESYPGASGGLWLHDPDGEKTMITDPDGSSTSGVSNVSGRGVVVGTERNQTAFDTVHYQPWMFRRGHVRLLASPGKLGDAVRKDYFAIAVNSRSVVAGIKTNRDRFAPSEPEYVSRPVLWPTPGSAPIKLGLPRGFSVPNYPARLVDVLTDGTITGVLRDGKGRYHRALWVTPGANPDLRPLPDTWVPTAVSGQWVTGNIGSTPDRIFLSSWNNGFVIDGPDPLFAGDVSSNGVFIMGLNPDTQTPTSYVGSPAHPVAELGSGVRASDVVGTSGGQVVVGRNGTAIEVISCALALPEATDITVTPFDLPATKVSP